MDFISVPVLSLAGQIRQSFAVDTILHSCEMSSPVGVGREFFRRGALFYRLFFGEWMLYFPNDGETGFPVQEKHPKREVKKQFGRDFVIE